MIGRVRAGDKRPFKRDLETRITFGFSRANPFRWLPGHGDPYCYAEWFSQKLIQVTAYLPVYTAIIATLTLLAVLFGIPFVGGD